MSNDDNVAEQASNAFFKVTGLDFDFDHVLIVSAIYGAAILLSVLVVSYRYQRKGMQLSVIPRKQMPIVRSTDLPAALKKSVLRNIASNM